MHISAYTVRTNREEKRKLRKYLQLTTSTSRNLASYFMKLPFALSLLVTEKHFFAQFITVFKCSANFYEMKAFTREENRRIVSKCKSNNKNNNNNKFKKEKFV